MRTFCVFFLLIVLHSAALIVAQRSSAPKNRTSSWQTLSESMAVEMRTGSVAALQLALLPEEMNLVILSTHTCLDRDRLPTNRKVRIEFHSLSILTMVLVRNLKE
ncbi:hypothetical protein HHK36_023951 [Tetracentron sinense]|uniref:Uncharacterized protein n=1 Tax=Tetracentron sinense TaxID=13715 RepID=A0A834YM76_TETSI|nr:hypothetical protein HHK36_023951 [Tetracentron sinense]